MSTFVNISFDAALFPELHIDWRISRNDDVTRTFILRLDSQPNAVDYHASELNLAPALRSATADSKPVATGAISQDSFASLHYSSWFAYDMQLNRSLLLAGSEGVLLVSDVLDVGQETAAKAMQAGPIWHFGPVAEPITSATEGWVASQNASVNLCVAFDMRHTHRGNVTSAPLHVGYQTVDVWSKPGQRTAFASTPLKGAGTYSFVSLLVPINGSDLPANTKRSFKTNITQTEDGLSATVTWDESSCVGHNDYCGKQLDLHIGAGGSSWEVQRHPLLGHG